MTVRSPAAVVFEPCNGVWTWSFRQRLPNLVSGEKSETARGSGVPECSPGVQFTNSQRGVRVVVEAQPPETASTNGRAPSQSEPLASASVPEQRADGMELEKPARVEVTADSVLLRSRATTRRLRIAFQIHFDLPRLAAGTFKCST